MEIENLKFGIPRCVSAKSDIMPAYLRYSIEIIDILTKYQNDVNIQKQEILVLHKISHVFQ